MTEIDWSKAPEGATHYDRKTGEFYRCDQMNPDGPKAQLWSETWINSGHWGSVSHWLSKIPVAKDWTGAGLPPVGTVCEYQCGYIEEPREHSKCKIIAHFEGESGSALAAFTYVAHDGVVQLGRGAPSLFRPIRTPEQIAAEDREKAIDEMWSVYWRPDAPTAKEALGLLYDAGYRLVQGGSQ